MQLPKLDIPNIIMKVWRKCQIFLIIITALALIGWTISPIRTWLLEVGVFDQSTIYYIVALTTTLLVTLISELKSGMTELSKKLDQFNKGSESQIIENGVGAVYPYLSKNLESIDNKSEKTLDVIGLTLYSAWPQIAPWIQSEKTKHWKIRLFLLDPKFIDGNKFLKSAWKDEAISKKSSIEDFQEEFKDVLAKKEIEISLVLYSNIPVIHGFKLGDGTLYVSFTHWSKRNIIDQPHYFYEYIACEDKTIRAKSYRQLFDNWVDSYWKNFAKHGIDKKDEK